MGLGASRQVGVKAGWRPAKGACMHCISYECLILCTYQKMSTASCAGDEAAQRLSQSGYDITPLTAQKKSELAAMLTDHQR